MFTYKIQLNNLKVFSRRYKKFAFIQYSKFIKNLLEILVEQGYIYSFCFFSNNLIKVHLKYSKFKKICLLKNVTNPSSKIKHFVSSRKNNVHLKENYYKLVVLSNQYGLFVYRLKSHSTVDNVFCNGFKVLEIKNVF